MGLLDKATEAKYRKDKDLFDGICQSEFEQAKKYAKEEIALKILRLLVVFIWICVFTSTGFLVARIQNNMSIKYSIVADSSIITVNDNEETSEEVMKDSFMLPSAFQTPEVIMPKVEIEKFADVVRDLTDVKIISPNGLRFIAMYEGAVINPDGLHVPYRCASGEFTIGYGFVPASNSHSKYTSGLTEREATELLAKTVKFYAETVMQSVPQKYRGRQTQIDALTSLCYNIGASGFRSFAKNYLNGKKTFAEIERGWKGYSYVGKIKNQSLYQRRVREWRLFYNGVYGLSDPVNYYEAVASAGRIVKP